MTQIVTRLQLFLWLFCSSSSKSEHTQVDPKISDTEKCIKALRRIEIDFMQFTAVVRVRLDIVPYKSLHCHQMQPQAFQDVCLVC